MSKAKLVIDFGHSIWKAKSATGSELEMPHAIVEISEAQYNNVYARSKENMPNDVLKVNGKCFAVGKSAEMLGSVQRFKGAERYKPEYYGVGAMAIINAMYGANQIDIEVFASHPPQDIQYADLIVDSLFAFDEWKIENGNNTKRINVTYASTFDEITGGFMNVMLTEDGARYQRPELKQGKIIGIDIGGGTTDFSEVVDGEMVEITTHSERIGIMNVIDTFLIQFRNRYKEETRASENLDASKVRKAIVTGQFSGRGKVFECFEEASQARNQLLNRINQVFQARYGGAFNYDAILLTGGGSALMFEALDHAFQHDNIILADDVNSLHFANVRGGLKLWRLYDHIGIE